MRRRTLLAGIVALVMVLAGCDWSQVSFGPQHTSHNPSEPTFTDTSLANATSPWSRPCLTCRGSLVAGNTLYFVGLDALRAIDTTTGHQLWEVPLGSDYKLVGLGNGLVYFLHQPSSGSH